MFDPVHFDARTDAEGKLHLDLTGVPPDTQVQVMVIDPTVPSWETVGIPPTPPVPAKRRFESREEWEAHVDRIAGSIPDLVRPEQWPTREIDPL